MVSNKGTKKAKKALSTTLGKACSKSKEKEVDISHVRKPIDTSISGIKHVLSLLETATCEVKDYVMYECDIMYECRLCRTIFRSLANFILHKRNYCKEKYNPFDYTNNNIPYQENIYPIPEKICSSKEEKQTLDQVIENLNELDQVRQLAKKVLSEDLSSKEGSKIVKNMDDHAEKVSNCNDVVLEKIDTNKSGVFQTLVKDSRTNKNEVCSTREEFTKSEVLEIHKILDNDVPVLDPDGKVCGFTGNKLHQSSIFPKSGFSCTECNQRFATQKTLTYHIKCRHNPTRIVYVCPTCKDTFANPWCVYRHLLKVHRMTNKQVRRMRDQVHNSCIRRDEESVMQKKKLSDAYQGEADSENQWINDIEEDNDFQMCAGCGKRFERKAALHSHSQMCAKRMEVCNSIKENAKKKEEEEATERAKSQKVLEEKPTLRGASKRKGQNILSYKRKPEEILLCDTKEPQTPKKGVKPTQFSCTSEKIDKANADNLEEPENLRKNLSCKKDLNPIIDKLVRQQGITNDATIKYVQQSEKSNNFGPKECNENTESTMLYLRDKQVSKEQNSKSEKLPDIQIDYALQNAENLEVESTANYDITNYQDKTDLQKNNIKNTLTAVLPPSNCIDVSNINNKNQNIRSPEKNISKHSQDLLNNEVSFETFCERVGNTAIVTGCDDGTRVSPRARGKRRKVHVTPPMRLSSETDDDVIFVGVDSKEEDVPRDSLSFENGFAGFSNEETNQVAYSIDDLSNLSYNNPLKRKQKELQKKAIKAVSDDTLFDQKQSTDRPARAVSVDVKNADLPLPKQQHNEVNFILRATPYMNRAKLLCIPCGITFKSFNVLLWHMSAHFSWFRFQCSKCSFITFNKYDCMLHARKDHNLKEDGAASFILPLPNWKTVLMSHEFRLLKGCADLMGKHTDEKIVFDDTQAQIFEISNEALESDAVLFGECSKSIIEETAESIVNNSENTKQLTDLGKFEIDIPETIRDFQILPEPIELGMPAHVSEVIRTIKFEDTDLPPVESSTTAEHLCEESNDDWIIPDPVRKIGEDANRGKIDDETCASNNRPSRIRTKPKQNDDFVYYNINNVVRSGDFVKTNNLQKLRGGTAVILKNKVSGRSVPINQKKK